MSAPTLPFKRGDRGPTIRRFKAELLDVALSRMGGQRLARIALRTEARHVYGPVTARCVARVQTRIGLKATGVADQRTVNALRRLATVGATRTTPTTPGIKYPTRTHYSPNFHRNELDCKCGCDTPLAIQQRLADTARAIEALRLILGVPIPVLSAYRCVRHNRAVGGASQSQHLTGRAFDPDVRALGQRGVKRAAVLAALRRIPTLNGIGSGYAHGGLHGDTRNPPRREW